MIIIEAGRDLYREHPAAPGEARRDAFGMIHAHTDAAARGGYGSPGSMARGTDLAVVKMHS